jgi:hypothetical protein
MYSYCHFICKGSLLNNRICGLALKLTSLLAPRPEEITRSIDRFPMILALYHEKISTKNEPNPNKSRAGPFIPLPDR